jgi:phospholipid-transporting ATPase
MPTGWAQGADTVIYERLDHNYVPNEEMKASTSRDMEHFGAAGLRTLCLSYAEVDRDWYTNVWMPEWVAAKTSLEDRENKVGEVSEKIERNLRLLGCTAIEDKLQEGVPDCIRQLALAGIRIWVLTGDKMETAINIGFACSLLTEEMHQVQTLDGDARGYGCSAGDVLEVCHEAECIACPASRSSRSACTAWRKLRRRRRWATRSWQSS